MPGEYDDSYFTSTHVSTGRDSVRGGIPAEPMARWRIDQNVMARMRYAEQRPTRTCTTCGAILSRFNAATICAPCTRTKTLTQDAEPVPEPQIPRANYCRRCKATRTVTDSIMVQQHQHSDAFARVRLALSCGHSWTVLVPRAIGA